MLMKNLNKDFNEMKNGVNRTKTFNTNVVKLNVMTCRCNIWFSMSFYELQATCDMICLNYRAKTIQNQQKNQNIRRKS